MQVIELPAQFGSYLRHQRVSIVASDLTALITAGAHTIPITGVGGFNTGSGSNPGFLTIPEAGKVIGVQQYLAQSFSGGSLSGLTCSVGKVGDSPTALTAPFDIFQAAGDTVVQETALFYSGQNSPWNVNVTFTPTGDVVGKCTQGQLLIYIAYLSVSEPPVGSSS